MHKAYIYTLAYIRIGVLAFGRFWRKFVIGDDWAIAMGVIWCLVTLVVFHFDLVNARYLLPFVVICMLGVLLWRASLRPDSGKILSTTQLRRRGFYALWLPMSIAGVLPFVCYCLARGDVSRMIILDCALIDLIALMVAAFGLRFFVVRWPFLASMMAAVMALLLAERVFLLVFNTSQSLSSLVVWGVAPAVAAFLAIALLMGLLFV